MKVFLRDDPYLSVCVIICAIYQVLLVLLTKRRMRLPENAARMGDRESV